MAGVAAGTDFTTLGVKFGYAVETTAGTKPTAFTQLERCRSVGGIDLSQEKIDLSCLEDQVTKYGKGRQDTGGDWSVKFLTGAVAQVKAMMSAANTAYLAGNNTWFEVWVPGLSDAFYVVAQPGTKIPLPEVGDNAALEFSLSLTIQDYKGLDTAIEPVAAT